MNKYIDHTVLKAFATKDDIIKLCNEAKEYNFKSVCVNPCYVKLAKELLQGSDVLVCTVIGFPLGANTIEVKALETKDAVANGAQEIDMVINVGKAKEHDYKYIEEEIKAVVNASSGNLVKVIIEHFSKLLGKIGELRYREDLPAPKPSSSGKALKYLSSPILLRCLYKLSVNLLFFLFLKTKSG